MTRYRFGWPLFLAVAVAGQALNVWDGWRRGDTFLDGDAGLYAAAAHSLLHDRDLDLFNQCFPAEYPSLDAAVKAQPRTPPDHPDWSEFGLTHDDRVTLKQSPVFAAAAVPFYAALGPVGLLLFNLVVLNLLLVGMATLGGDSSASRVAVLVAYLTTPLWRYAFNFSPDLFLCALLVWSVVAARSGRPFAAGVLGGVAVGTKAYVVLFALPILPVVWFDSDRRFRGVLLFALGGAVGVAPALAFSTWLFGAPWATGYERQLKVENGTKGLADHLSLFRTPVLDGLRYVFVRDTRYHRDGLLLSCPLWVLWPVAAVVVLARSTRRSWVAAAVGVILANVALFVPYDDKDASRIGNRYLFPAVVFGFALIAAAADRLTAKFAGREETAVGRGSAEGDARTRNAEGSAGGG